MEEQQKELNNKIIPFKAKPIPNFKPLEIKIETLPLTGLL